MYLYLYIYKIYIYLYNVYICIYNAQALFESYNNTLTKLYI